jgi:hypothetical protein
MKTPVEMLYLISKNTPRVLIVNRSPFNAEIFEDVNTLQGKQGTIYRLHEHKHGVELSETLRRDYDEKHDGYKTLINLPPVEVDNKKGLKALKAAVFSLFEEHQYNRDFYGNYNFFTIYFN